MKSMAMKWLARSAFVTLVATVMVFAGPKFAVAQGDCNDPERLGYCPPYNNFTCASDCVLLGYEFGGSCVGGESGGCCTCFM